MAGEQSRGIRHFWPIIREKLESSIPPAFLLPNMVSDSTKHSYILFSRRHGGENNLLSIAAFLANLNQRLVFIMSVIVICIS